MAALCFGLGLVVVHKGRDVRIGTDAIAADVSSVDLGRVFGSVGVPAASSTQAVGGAERSAGDAASSVARTATALDQVRSQLRALTPLFDETAARAARIEAKLRPLRLGP